MVINLSEPDDLLLGITEDLLDAVNQEFLTRSYSEIIEDPCKSKSHPLATYDENAHGTNSWELESECHQADGDSSPARADHDIACLAKRSSTDSIAFDSQHDNYGLDSGIPVKSCSLTCCSPLSGMPTLGYLTRKEKNERIEDPDSVKEVETRESALLGLQSLEIHEDASTAHKTMSTIHGTTAEKTSELYTDTSPLPCSTGFIDSNPPLRSDNEGPRESIESLWDWQNTYCSQDDRYFMTAEELSESNSNYNGYAPSLAPITTGFEPNFTVRLADPNGKMECVICYKSGLRKDFVLLDRCSHQFCSDCILSWKDKRSTCPLCRLKYKKILLYHYS